MKTIELWPQKYNPNYPKFPIDTKHFKVQLSWGIMYKGIGVDFKLGKHHLHLYAGYRYRIYEWKPPMTMKEILLYTCPVHGFFSYNKYLGIEIGVLNIRGDHWKDKSWK